MGQLHSFKCQSCGYYAEVSGGDDAGMMIVTTTISCGVCRELYDAVVHKVREPWLGDIEPRCPRAKRHAVTVWTHPGPCPKCGEPLDYDPEGITALWD